MTSNKNTKAEVKKVLSEEEFENMMDDFSVTDEVLKKATVKKGRKMIGRRSSVVLPESAIEEISAKAEKIGLGYQTMLRILILEKLNDDRNKNQVA